jgi:hypothetical protein
VRSRVANELGQEATPSLLRHRGKQHRLSLEEKVDVVWRVRMQHEFNKDVAKHYRISQQTVSRLVCQVRKKPGLLSELLSKQEEQKAERQRIGEALHGLTGRSGFLESVASCVKELEKQGFRGLNVLLVRAVMREDLGMRFRKVR